LHTNILFSKEQSIYLKRGYRKNFAIAPNRSIPQAEYDGPCAYGTAILRRAVRDISRKAFAFHITHPNGMNITCRKAHMTHKTHWQTDFEQKFSLGRASLYFVLQSAQTEIETENINQILAVFEKRFILLRTHFKKPIKPKK